MSTAKGGASQPPNMRLPGKAGGAVAVRRTLASTICRIADPTQVPRPRQLRDASTVMRSRPAHQSMINRRFNDRASCPARQSPKPALARRPRIHSPASGKGGRESVILIRPAVMFGPDDGFLTAIARLLRILPVYPMFGRGETKLQPVYVEDVVEGIARVLGGAGGGFACCEFAAARVYTYKELVRIVADRMKVRARLVPLPFALWRVLASGAEFLPGSPLTRNQVALMRRDNIASADYPGLSSLDITPTEIETLRSAVVDRS